MNTRYFLLYCLLHLSLLSYSQVNPGNALNFDGVDDYVQFPASNYFDGDFTIEAWMYTREYNHYPRLCDFGNGPATDNVLLAIYPTTGYPTLYIDNSSGHKHLWATKSVPLNQWFHIACVLDGTNAKIYLDGHLVAETNSMSIPENISRSQCYLARSLWTTDDYLNGKIDEFRIWNYAKSLDQIKEHMHQPLAGTENGLVAYYVFDHSIGNTLMDVSNAPYYDGTLMNMTNDDWVTSKALIQPVLLPVSEVEENRFTINWQDINNAQMHLDVSTHSTFDTLDVMKSMNIGNVKNYELTGLSPGTEYYYRLKSETTLLSDYSETGMAMTKGEIPGKGIEFNGSDEWIDLQDFSLPDSFSVEFWFKADNPSVYNCIIGKHTYEGSNLFIIGYYHNQMRLTIRNEIIKIEETFQDTCWFHLAAVYQKTSESSTNVQVYKNGQLIHNETLNDVLGDITGKSWVIGQDWDDVMTKDDYFDGMIDEVRFWGKPLSQQEIQTNLYKELSGNENELIAYYNFNTIHSSVVPDLSGNQFHGKLLPGANKINRWKPSCALIIPTAKKATNITGNGFIAHWDTLPGAPSYIIELSDTVDFSNSLFYDTLTTNTYAFNSLSPGKTYYYRVKAITYITSPWSNIIKTSTIISPPGNALVFDGVDDYVSFSNSSIINQRNQGTIAGWFKSNSSSSQMLFCMMEGEQTIADHIFIGINGVTSSYDDESFWYVMATNGAPKLYMYVRKGNGYFSDGQWHHFAVSLGGGNNAIYIDGERQRVTFHVGTKETNEFIDVMNPNVFRLGNRHYNKLDGYQFQGEMDDFSIWDYPLSKNEIKHIMHKELNGNEHGLLCYYPFNETAGSWLYDQTTNNIDGALKNMTDSSWVESYAVITPFARKTRCINADGCSIHWDSIPDAQMYYLQLSTDESFSNVILNDSTHNNFYHATGLNDTMHIYHYSIWCKTQKISDTSTSYIIKTPGNALSFDGIDDYAKAYAYHEELSSPEFSITFWAKVTGGANTWRTVISNRGNYIGTHIYAGMNNQWEFWIGNGGWNVLYSSEEIIKDQWYYIVCTYDGHTAKLYINGEPDQQMNVSGYVLNTMYPVAIGKESESAGTFFFNGLIDEVSFWDTALSKKRINSIMHNSLQGDEAGLTAYYDFDEILSNQLPDKSGNEHDMYLKNIDVNTDWNVSNALITPFARNATEISNSGFTANWDTIPNVNGYYLQISDDEGFANILYDTLIDANSFRVTGLQEGVRFYYRVKSRTYKTSEYSNTADVQLPMTIPGNALSFNGSSQRIDAHGVSTENFRRGFTLEAWIKTPDNSHHSKFLGFYTSAGGNRNLLCTSNDKFTYYDQTTHYLQSGDLDDTIANNTWYHVAMVIEPNNNCYLYQNGKQIVSFVTSVLPVTDGKFTIGCDWDGGAVNDFFNGSMDELRIWNYPRTQNQIQQNMHTSVSASASGLVAYYNVDNLSGITLNDLTSNDYHGTLINMNDDNWQPSMAIIQPTAREATNISYSSFVANWDTVPGVTDYILDISTDQYFNVIDIKDSILIHQTKYFIDTLNNETHYYYRLRYYKDTLSAYSNTINLVTPARKPRIMNDSITNICDYDTLRLRSNYMINNKYQWYRNDSMISGANTDVYLVDSSGTYKFRAIDTLWNDTAWSDPVAITIHNSDFGTSFMATDTTLNGPNQGEFLFSVHFINSTPGMPNHQYYWDFGDDSAGFYNPDTVQHIYKYNGKYDVMLNVTDTTTGCTQQLTKPEYIICKGGIDNINTELLISGNTRLCPGDSVKIACREHNADIYQWRKNGMNIGGANDSIYLATEEGTYTCYLTISGISATKETEPANIDTFNTIAPVILHHDELDACMRDSLTLYLDTNYADYHWSTGSTSKQITIDQPGDYTVTVIDENNCTLASASSIIDYSYIPIPGICMVTVDTGTNHNVIVWDKIDDGRIAGYYVYKELNSDNNFVLIDSVMQGGLTVVEDAQSDPKVSAEKYRISAFDTCGNETAMSAFHKTIHLQVNIGTSGERNLSWDDYLIGDYDSLNNINATKAFGSGNYHIYRGTDSTQLILYTTRPASSTTWSDFDTSQVYYYRVAAHKTDTCNPLASLKASGGPYSRSVSNLEDNRLKDDNRIVNFEHFADIHVSPNPFTNVLNISLNLKQSNHVSMKLNNALGQPLTVVENQMLNAGCHQYDLNIEMPGKSCILEITIQGTSKNIKLIKE